MVEATRLDTGARLTGGKVALIFAGFFGVVFAVNGLMAFDAISTFRGQVSDHPYEDGVNYNSELARAEAQNERHWKVDVALEDGVRATFHDAQDRPIEGLTVTGVFQAPADTKRDRAVALIETGPGLYTLDAAAPAGVWDLALQAKSGPEILFRSHNRVTLR